MTESVTSYHYWFYAGRGVSIGIGSPHKCSGQFTFSQNLELLMKELDTYNIKLNGRLIDIL